MRRNLLRWWTACCECLVLGVEENVHGAAMLFFFVSSSDIWSFLWSFDSVYVKIDWPDIAHWYASGKSKAYESIKSGRNRLSTPWACQADGVMPCIEFLSPFGSLIDSWWSILVTHHELCLYVAATLVWPSATVQLKHINPLKGGTRPKHSTGGSDRVVNVVGRKGGISISISCKKVLLRIVHHKGSVAT